MSKDHNVFDLKFSANFLPMFQKLLLKSIHLQESFVQSYLFFRMSTSTWSRNQARSRGMTSNFENVKTTGIQKLWNLAALLLLADQLLEDQVAFSSDFELDGLFVWCQVSAPGTWHPGARCRHLVPGTKPKVGKWVSLKRNIEMQLWCVDFGSVLRTP